MNFDLPIISPDANPEFADAAACADWLKDLPLINVGPAHGRLLGQLEELNCFGMPPGERIKILEMMLDAVAFVQAEHAKKFTAKAVPLSRPEREVFENVLALWDAFAHGWLHCVAALETDAAARSSAAMVCQRLLWCIGQRIAEHFKAYQSVPERDWQRLNQAYAAADARGIAELKIAQPLHREGSETSCSETFSQALLFARSKPSEQTPRQQAVIARWAERWAGKITISRNASEAAAHGAPLAVDLNSAAAASRTQSPSPSVRYLGVGELSKSLKKRIVMLHSGSTPESLGLGSDVPSAMAANLLVGLHREWCEEEAVRKPRRGGAPSAELCSGLAAMHFCITGQTFRQPVAPKELSQRERNEIATFGRVSTREEEDSAAQHSSAVEAWEIREENLTEMRLERPVEAGSRFHHHQLVAVRPSDAKSFLMCTVHWLSVSPEGKLCLGVRVIPGVPQGVAVRATGVNALTEKYVPALSLPAVPALQSPATLLLPSGWYRPKRIIELHLNTPRQVLLSAALERGSNFDRCTYETV